MKHTVVFLVLFAFPALAPAQCPGGRCSPWGQPPSVQFAPPAVGEYAPWSLAPRPSSQNPHVDPRCIACSVRIENYRGNLVESGSGTVIAREGTYGCVITCKHLFSDGVGQLVVPFPDGQRLQASYLGSDSQADLAAVAIQAGASTPMTSVAASPIARGEQVYQVGYPHGHGPVPRAGQALGIVGRAGSATVLGLSFPVQQGDSGSGVFRSADGALVGVLWGSDGRTSSVTGVADIQRFLDEKCFRWFPHLRRPQQPSSPVSPSTPGPVGPTPPVLPPSGPSPTPAQEFSSALAALDKVSKQLDALQTQVNDLKNRPSAKDGRDGVVGPAGPAGPPGPSGNPPDLNPLLKRIEALEQQSAANAGKIQRIRIVPATNNP